MECECEMWDGNDKCEMWMEILCGMWMEIHFYGYLDVYLVLSCGNVYVCCKFAGK